MDPTGDDLTDAFGAYLPEDRLAELHGGPAVPGVGEGSVLFADVVGFTGLTTRLAELLGARRGAEEVPVYLNRLYEVLIGEVRARSGSVIGFAGDAITCWFPGDDGRVAVTCGHAMQAGMGQFTALSLPGAASTPTFSLRLKVVVTAGRVRRFVTGDPAIQLLDVIAGEPLAQIEALESAVSPGEVLVSEEVGRALGTAVRAGGAGAVVAGRRATPALDASLSKWLLPTVQQRLAAGGGDFLTELRPVAALFLSFGGIDLAEDDEAHVKFGAVVRYAQRIAADYEGNVLQVTCGDKGSYLYMAFGAPVSHEDDVRRCATAAIELRSALSEFGFLTHVAIGLGHGTARTGAYGSADRRTYGALGEGTNMAARMMSAAPHGSVYVSGAFADALGSGFELHELDGVRVKGRARPVRAFRLMGLAEQRDAQPDAHGPLLGRSRELELLQAGIGAAFSGEGRVVQIVAEAGMGKSELLRHALVSARGLKVVRANCQAFGRTAPYHPWKAVYHELLELREDGPVSQRVARVQAALAAIDPALAGQADLLRPILGLPAGADGGAGTQDAEERSAARRVLLLTIFRHAARRVAEQGLALALVLEDLHWLDPASAELLVAVGRAVPALPVVLITTTRPAGTAGESPPVELEGAISVRLSPLDHSATAQLVTERLSAARQLAGHADELVAPIVERSGGNPFYAHELVTYLLQRAAADDAAGALPAAPLASVLAELPTSLHSLILGRLDRLGTEQQLDLKVASVVGREFLTSWVSACQPARAVAAAEASFEATGRAGLTQRLSHDAPAHEFNHAITRDVVYHSLPRASQARLHTALARFVESDVATTAEPHLDLLAYHFALGEDLHKARHYLGAAGTAAKAAYANRAALDYFGQLLELQHGLERLPTLLELGEVSSFVGAYPAAEAQLQEALHLAREGGDRLRQATALRLLGELHERQGDHTGARGHLEAAAALCRELEAKAELTRVLLALGGNVLWQLGEYGAAAELLEEAVELARAANDARAAARALHGTANIHLYRGDWDAAEAAFSESLTVRRAAHDDYGVANALNNLAIVYANAGNGERAEELFRESLTIRQRLGDASGVAVALNNLGYMTAERGDLTGARALYEESLGARRVLGDRLGLAVSLNSLGTLLLRSGEVDGAAELFRESATLAAAIDNRREAAAALAGLANATPDSAHAARVAGVAELILAQLGAAVDAEVREHLERVRSRSGAAEVPEQFRAASLATVVAWALQNSEPFSE